MKFTLVKLLLFSFSLAPCFTNAQRPSSGVNNVWYTHNSSDTVFVFVHGILSDSRDAWYYDAGTEEHSIYWPELVDTTQFDNPSIFLGGFYTEILSGDYTIRDASEELFTYLSVSNPPAQFPVLAKKNIIFVAHSLGGIAVRYLLTKRREAFQGKNIGLFLVASPSLGSKDSNRLEFLINAVDQKMGAELRWNDPKLADLDKDFRNLIDSNRNQSIVGMETLESRFFTPFLFLFEREVVVEETSGGRYFGAPIRIGGTDHSTIAKPDSNTAQVHTVLRRFYEQKFKPMVVRNTPKVSTLVCRLRSIRDMGWRSGHKTNFCIANGYPQGNFNQGDYKNGGICMAGNEPAICQAYIQGALPNNVECKSVGQEVHCFRKE